MKKQTILARIAPLLLAAALALAGIWLNSRAVVLKSGQPPQTQTLAQGCALTGWQQIKPGVWQFLFHTAAEEPLALFLAEPGRPTANGQPMQPLGEEFFLLSRPKTAPLRSCWSSLPGRKHGPSACPRYSSHWSCGASCS